MPKISEYLIVRRHLDDTDNFTAQVNKRIAEGYQPYGSLAVSACSNHLDDTYLIQAMVKHDDFCGDFYAEP